MYSRFDNSLYIFPLFNSKCISLLHVLRLIINVVISDKLFICIPRSIVGLWRGFLIRSRNRRKANFYLCHYRKFFSLFEFSRFNFVNQCIFSFFFFKFELSYFEGSGCHLIRTIFFITVSYLTIRYYFLVLFVFVNFDQK